MGEIEGCEVLVFDTETTGLGGSARILEVGLVDYRSGLTVVDSMVKTEHVPQDVTYIHGLDAVDTAPGPSWGDLRPVLREAFSSCVGLLVYNASFDVGMLRQTDRQWVREHGGDPLRVPKVVECAMEAFAEWYGDWSEYHGNYRWQKLATACSCMGVEESGHDALADSQATRLVVRSLVDRGRARLFRRLAGLLPELTEGPASPSVVEVAESARAVSVPRPRPRWKTHGWRHVVARKTPACIVCGREGHLYEFGVLEPDGWFACKSLGCEGLLDEAGGLLAFAWPERLDGWAGRERSGWPTGLLASAEACVRRVIPEPGDFERVVGQVTSRAVSFRRRVERKRKELKKSAEASAVRVLTPRPCVACGSVIPATVVRTVERECSQHCFCRWPGSRSCGEYGRDFEHMVYVDVCEDCRPLVLEACGTVELALAEDPDVDRFRNRVHWTKVHRSERGKAAAGKRIEAEVRRALVLAGLGADGPVFPHSEGLIRAVREALQVR